jgi:hypothetical protein
MTTDITPYEDRQAQLAQIVTQSRQALAEILAAVETLDEAADGEEDIIVELNTIWDQAQTLAAYIGEQAQAIVAMTAVTREVVEQRDQAVTKLSDLNQALDESWATDNQRVLNFIDEIQEDHNVAFWESLPYDMAYMMGGEWDYIKADALYQAITMDMGEKEEGDYDTGYTREELIAFRSKLLDLIKELTGR